MLTSEQKLQLREDGYLHLPQAVSRELIDNALHHVNWKIGGGIPADQLTKWSSQSFFPELSRTPPISDLFNESGLLQIAQSLMGEENVGRAGSAQLALRFPREPGSEARAPGPHIDGLHTPNNGVPEGTVGSFTALIGVFLTDVLTEDAGNFCVWPGSHHKLEAHFREHGTQMLFEGKMPKIDLGPAKQLKVRAGDAALCHYQLAHGVAHNIAPNPRFATFFRLKHPQHDAHRAEILTDVWHEWKI